MPREIIVTRRERNPKTSQLPATVCEFSLCVDDFFLFRCCCCWRFSIDSIEGPTQSCADISHSNVSGDNRKIIFFYYFEGAQNTFSPKRKKKISKANRKIDNIFFSQRLANTFFAHMRCVTANTYKRICERSKKQVDGRKEIRKIASVRCEWESLLGSIGRDPCDCSSSSCETLIIETKSKRLKTCFLLHVLLFHSPQR